MAVISGPARLLTCTNKRNPLLRRVHGRSVLCGSLIKVRTQSDLPNLRVIPLPFLTCIGSEKY